MPSSHNKKKLNHKKLVTILTLCSWIALSLYYIPKISNGFSKSKVDRINAIQYIRKDIFRRCAKSEGFNYYRALKDCKNKLGIGLPSTSYDSCAQDKSPICSQVFYDKPTHKQPIRLRHLVRGSALNYYFSLKASRNVYIYILLIIVLPFLFLYTPLIYLISIKNYKKFINWMYK